MQAEIKGNREDLVSDKPIAAHVKARKILIAKGKGEKRTNRTPAQAPIVINTSICHVFTFHTRLSTIHIPIVRAAISGNIISFSCKSSEKPTIANKAIIEDRYLLNLFARSMLS